MSDSPPEKSDSDGENQRAVAAAVPRLFLYAPSLYHSFEKEWCSVGRNYHKNTN
ncbi:hypothetical protein [Haloferax volcanii]|uniref:Uncharacterized protein n=1 Tax=Haloferax volcanii TaxID=2246 RepID=A0A8T5CTA9_HALVO|nr:hypothetical protein [Haloferax volcanii]MBS8117717.1 hypothetical protein [Haloferax volcanii]MBS8122729.1 hypothetical protein [Haloferax volcanii]MBS8126597.1 hypothetical protein [Haloferax volcanii]MBS8130463.1 hypothetical protein [Haloferax volcanii]MDW7537510.1 hypothetical protein [Haloferax volcanii]